MRLIFVFFVCIVVACSSVSYASSNQIEDLMERNKNIYEAKKKMDKAGMLPQNLKNYMECEGAMVNKYYKSSGTPDEKFRLAADALAKCWDKKGYIAEDINPHGEYKLRAK